MQRRDFLAASPVALIASALPAIAAPTAADPHPAWLHDWRAASAAWHNNLTEDCDETQASEAAWARRMQIEQKLLVTPAKTPEGAAALVQWVLEDSHCDFTYQEYGRALKLAVAALGQATNRAPNPGSLEFSTGTAKNCAGRNFMD